MQREAIELYCKAAYKEICKKHRTFANDYLDAFKLLNHHLCPSKPERPIAPKRLVHLHDGEGFQVWKYQVMAQGLRPGQWPRLWVGVIPGSDLLVPLVLDMHGNNYDDSAHEANAVRLIGDQYLRLSAD